MLVADLPPVPAQETPIVWVQTGALLPGRWDSPGWRAERGYMRRNARWLLRPTRADFSVLSVNSVA
jgi:hypothetical protein